MACYANKIAPGGRVVVSTIRYADDPLLQRELLAGALEARNMPIDLLHCVPPLVSKVGRGTRR